LFRSLEVTASARTWPDFRYGTAAPGVTNIVEIYPLTRSTPPANRAPCQ
jgi:hypothetical protein